LVAVLLLLALAQPGPAIQSVIAVVLFGVVGAYCLFKFVRTDEKMPMRSPLPFYRWTAYPHWLWAVFGLMALSLATVALGDVVRRFGV
jgi:hypothetical protein